VNEDDWIGVKSTFTPNFPANTTEEAENAAKLDGIVSRATQLALLSCVDDVNAELEAIKEEEEQLKASTNSYGDFREHDHSHDGGEADEEDDS